MARLSEQMWYFLNKKITEDSNWRDVELCFRGRAKQDYEAHSAVEDAAGLSSGYPEMPVWA